MCQLQRNAQMFLDNTVFLTIRSIGVFLEKTGKLKKKKIVIRKTDGKR